LNSGNIFNLKTRVKTNINAGVLHASSITTRKQQVKILTLVVDVLFDVMPVFPFLQFLVHFFSENDKFNDTENEMLLHDMTCS
jgi:hypothetical protein